MSVYKVEVRISGRELYWVTADSEEAAMKNWHDGEIFLAEVLDADAISATEEKQ